MTTADYLEALDTIEALVEVVYLDRLEDVRKIILEIRFNAHFNQQFREETIEQLDGLIQDLYEKSQRED